MNENLVKCRVCGTTNRLPPPTPGRRPICGKCKSPLAVRGPVHVTDSTFGDHVERSPLPVLVDLWAEWCGPCHMIAPTVDQLASEMDGRLTVAKINID
jgi:thioredoxin 2